MVKTFRVRWVQGLTLSMLVAAAPGCGGGDEGDGADTGGDAAVPDSNGAGDVEAPDTDTSLPDVPEPDVDAGQEPDADAEIDVPPTPDADAGSEPELDVMVDTVDVDSGDAEPDIDAALPDVDADPVDIIDVPDVPVVACGDGVVSEGEACDGVLAEGQDCVALGFDGGDLVCDESCAVDSSGCFDSVCGDGVCDGPETLGSCTVDCLPPGFVVIEPGTFSMGSPVSEPGRNADEVLHEVTITRAFAIQTTEVTQAQWRELSGGSNPACFQTVAGNGCTFGNENGNGPVEQIDWYSALAFANVRSVAEGLEPCYTLTDCFDPINGWTDGEHVLCGGATFVGLACTGYRLPTEAEFEYATRAGTSTATWLGDLTGVVSNCSTAQPSLDPIAWWCSNSFSRSQQVASKAANPLGLFDMLGNVREWTWDGLAAYPESATDPLGDNTSTTRAVRGGDWNASALGVRSAYRVGNTPESRISVIGFRLVRSVL